MFRWSFVLFFGSELLFHHLTICFIQQFLHLTQPSHVSNNIGSPLPPRFPLKFLRKLLRIFPQLDSLRAIPQYLEKGTTKFLSSPIRSRCSTTPNAYLEQFSSCCELVMVEPEGEDDLWDAIAEEVNKLWYRHGKGGVNKHHSFIKRTSTTMRNSRSNVSSFKHSRRIDT